MISGWKTKNPQSGGVHLFKLLRKACVAYTFILSRAFLYFSEYPAAYTIRKTVLNGMKKQKRPAQASANKPATSDRDPNRAG